jgi:hypothetical protein
MAQSQTADTVVVGGRIAFPEDWDLRPFCPQIKELRRNGKFQRTENLQNSALKI